MPSKRGLKLFEKLWPRHKIHKKYLGIWNFLVLFRYKIWQGLYWYFEFLEAYNLGYFEEGIIKKIRFHLPTQERVSLKNEVLSKYCYSEVLFFFRQYYQLILEDRSKQSVSGCWILFFNGTLIKFPGLQERYIVIENKNQYFF